MRIPVGLLVLALAGHLFSAPAQAQHAGYARLEVPGTADGQAPIPVALYYPGAVPEKVIPMGPFTVTVAYGAPPAAKVKGLILLSHGTGGTELGHSSLAEALARHGYLVAALRHPGDNWQDRSLLRAGAARYVTERPQQASRVIDALLRDPAWAARIASDGRGPRVGALGHSVGGYTVLALAGARPEPGRIAAHCQANGAEDPVFCGVARHAQSAAAAGGAPAPMAIPVLADPRVRAVVAMASAGAMFDAASLAQVRVPVALYEAEKDRFNVPRFHNQWIAANLPGATVIRVENAWHFAFMETPSVPIMSEDGDVRANPPGFDRPALLKRLAVEIPAFFDQAWERGH
ncbi:MAG: dienelactone hydrolase [Betaproteobacteria bacterium]|nr:dienelactone hydrolase [Betaproteobacteria bacterium]